MKKRLLRLLLIILGLALAALLIAAVSFRLADHTNGTLVSSGERRTYLLHVPARYDPSVPTPLVITLHGFAQWPAHQMTLSHWNDLADRQGFLVVYPSGTQFPRRWRAGGMFGRDADALLDVTFIADLIDRLEDEYNIDPARVYVNGLSNGGGMSFVLSCALSERIAAVGMVAGAYVFPWDECKPTRPVPAIVFHGTNDPIVPFRGGPAGRFSMALPTIPEWVGTLARRHDCDATPNALQPSGDVSGVQYVNCGADVVFYTIAGGGHTWPGGEVLPAILTGTTTQTIDATEMMWDFFQQHPLPGTGMSGVAIGGEAGS